MEVPDALSEGHRYRGSKKLEAATATSPTLPKSAPVPCVLVVVYL